MNRLWAGMIIIGILYGGFTGNIDAVGEAVIECSKEAVTLGISMLGVMAFWLGLMEVATEAGVIQSMSKKIQPIFHWLFPRIPIGSKAQEYMTTNMIANVLGLGWAATPAGLQAMEELEKENKKRNQDRKIGENRKDRRDGWASNEMCTFLVLNISSLQLIPINIIAYRSQYGSVSPTQIVFPAILATMASTLAGILFCKIMCRKYEY